MTSLGTAVTLRVPLKALRAIRAAEMELVTRLLPAGARVLEIGGGSGTQARLLAQCGFEITSIDLDSNPYAAAAQEWPVQVYDGRLLPFPDGSFAAVFSSNVLEHVVDLSELLGEVGRVLRKDGVAIHLMPTATWRAVTLLTHYPWLLLMLARVFMHRSASPGPTSNHSSGARGRTPVKLLRSVIMAGRHGERGSALSELWLFSAKWWRAQFEREGWVVVDELPGRLFYSGYFVTYPWLGLRSRQWLARFLGSSCRAYLVKQTEA